MSLKNFILSKLFLKHLGIAIGIVVGSALIFLIWINFYTRHGQARSVPDFIGLTVEQSARLARKSKLRYQIIDSVYTTLVPRGTIAEQNPKPGFKVKKRRTVILTLNAFHPEMVAMPNLVDLPKRQALKLMESAGIEIGQLRYKPDLSVDVVLEQLYNGKNIAEGDSIQKGSVVDIVLGKGLSNERTPVPDLIGLTLESAKIRLMEASLNLGTFLYDNSIATLSDSINAFVFKQNPEYRSDASLQMGSAVYLWMTVDSSKLVLKADTTLNTDTIPVVTPEGQTPNQIR